jgi:thioredoxin-like negative regulator of GroEL
MQNVGQHGDASPLESDAQLRNELMSTVKITDETFEQAVLQAELPVLVDFWAEWCPPCKKLKPVLENMA